MKNIRGLPNYSSAKEQSPANKKDFKYIPKKIFQTWETDKVTPGMYNAVHTWIDKNPDWECYFFDSASRRDFIKQHFPKEVLDAYDVIVPGAYKADLWRYCVLYINGGVYSDIKQELLCSLNDVMPHDIEFLSIKDRNRSNNEFAGYIYQAFICARPKHPFLKKAIDMIIDNVASGCYGYDDLSPTGPGLLGKAINLVLNRSELEAHVAGDHSVAGYRYSLLPKPNPSSKICKTSDNKPFFLTEYLGFREEQAEYFVNNIGYKYQYCWYNNKVYKHDKVNRTTPVHIFKKGLRKELAGGVARMYKRGDKKAAHKEIIYIIKDGNFCWRLLEVFFSYSIKGLFKSKFFFIITLLKHSSKG